jgi:hypothetical protein
MRLRLRALTATNDNRAAPNGSVARPPSAVRTLTTRLARPSRRAADRLRAARCDARRDWWDVCVVTVDGGTETWATDKPEICPHCGWAPQLVRIEVVGDWRTVARSAC